MILSCRQSNIRGRLRAWPWVVVLVLALVVAAGRLVRADAPATKTGALPTFVKVTKAAGIDFEHSVGDDAMSNLPESVGSGCAFFDYNGDGLLDVYFVSECYRAALSDVRGRKLAGKKSNKLYHNNGDGTFSDVTDRAGVGDPQGFGMACGAADYDNDGDADLFVTNYGPNVLFRNNGDGTFTNATTGAGLDNDLFGIGFAWLDYDNDGDVDIYLGNYIDYDPQYRYYYAADRFPGPMAYEGRPDVLYSNNGDGTFTDVTQSAGLYNPHGRAMGVTACDYDMDGDTDVFVANDAMENYFYRNEGNGVFTDIAVISGAAFGARGEGTSAMGPVFGDVNLDGRMDLYVPDMRYGCLYVATEDGMFEDATNRTGMAEVLGQYTSWSGNLLDYDNDGDLDVFTANGSAHRLEGEEDVLLGNRGDGTFEDVSARSGEYFSQSKFIGRGSAIGDYDNDGDLDVLLLNLEGPGILLRNDCRNGNNWLTIRLVGTKSNRDSIGATVTAVTGPRRQTSSVGSASGYLSQSDSRVHFGFGGKATVDRLEIRWPSGIRLTLENVKTNQFLTLTEPNK